jgi:hypothetical protein
MKRLLGFIFIFAAPISAQTHSAVLTWPASPTPSVTYNLYRSNISGGPYTIENTSPIAGTSFTDTANLSAGQTYCYVATAVNSAGQESAFGGQGCVTIPSDAPIAPPVVSLTLNPSTITAGQSATITLISSGETSCSGTFSQSNASTGVSPTVTTVYPETCIGPGGSTSVSTTLTVNAISAPKTISRTVTITIPSKGTSTCSVSVNSQGTVSISGTCK